MSPSQPQSQTPLPVMPNQPAPLPMFGQQNTPKKKPGQTGPTAAPTVLGEGGNPTNSGVKTLLGA